MALKTIDSLPKDTEEIKEQLGEFKETFEQTINERHFEEYKSNIELPKYDANPAIDKQIPIEPIDSEKDDRPWEDEE